MTRARRALPLLLLATLLLVPVGARAASHPQAAGRERVAVTFEVAGVSFEDLLAAPELRGLAAEGGAGLLSGGYERVGARSEPVPSGDQRVVAPVGTSPETLAGSIRSYLRGLRADDVQVIVVGTAPSDAMAADRDELLPVVLARGAPEELLAAMDDPPADAAALGTLTSDSTRRDGVVAGPDVGATVLEFLRVPRPESAGSPIRIVPGPAPFELHERYLAHRRMYLVVGAAAAIYVTLAGLFAVACTAGERVPSRVRRIGGWASLSVPALATGLLAAGHLPELSYATVVPFVALVTALGTMAFSPLEREDLLRVPAAIGVAVLAYFAVEAAFGWTAALTPFAGGSQLDGGRFYGLPNVDIGLLIGAALYVAQRLSTPGGFALIVGVGLFAGLPLLGANLGGAVSLFAAAGLWLAIRERDRLGPWWGIAVVAGVTVLGTVLILAAHAVSPVVTHVTRFEREVGGIGGVLGRFADRLEVGFDLIARNPLAVIPVLGIPASLLVVLRPPAAVRAAFERWPVWRDAVLVTLLAGAVAYVVNDSGPAAAGFAFGLGLGGMIGVSLLAGAGKMEEP